MHELFAYLCSCTTWPFYRAVLCIATLSHARCILQPYFPCTLTNQLLPKLLLFGSYSYIAIILLPKLLLFDSYRIYCKPSVTKITVIWQLLHISQAFSHDIPIGVALGFQFQITDFRLSKIISPLEYFYK